MDEIEVVVAHRERATVRVGEAFLKIDVEQAHTDVEVEAMRLAPVPTPEVLWRRPPVLALAALRGRAIATLGEPDTAGAAVWRAAGATVRRLHDAPLPSWPSAKLAGKRATLEEECAWLLETQTLPRDLVEHNRELAQHALTETAPVFVHGDLQCAHVFVEDDEVTGILDWTEAGQGPAALDLASLSLGHRERLDDLLAGYGDADRDAIRGWWSLRSLTSIRWLLEHGYDPALPGCEVDVLKAQM